MLPLDIRITAAVQALREIESKYGISIYAKGRAYGGAWLAIRDHSTGEIFDVDEIERGEWHETDHFGAS